MPIPKINLNALVKPKIFWPSLVILLALCITFYGQKEKEKSIRLAKETELLRTIEAKRVVENNLEQAKKEITKRDEEIKLTLDKLEKEISTRKEVEAQLVTVTKEKQDLAVQIEELAAALPKNIELEKIVVKPIRKLTGKVIAFDKENTFVVINLGSRDDLKLGDVLSVYRNDKFIGKVQVEKVEEETSAAVILTPWRNVEYRESDAVRKL